MSFGKKNKPISISPLEVLRWLESNVDIGMNLDIPIWKDFDSPLKQSLENFRIFEQNRINYDFKLYNILHGRTLAEMETWYDAVKGFAFDGWALGIKPSINVYLQTLGYMFLYEKDARCLQNNCHYFGVSSFRNMMAASMLAKHFDVAVTFDSASYDLGGRYRGYYFPLNVRRFVYMRRQDSKSMKSVPCKCPVCSNITIEDLYSPDTSAGLLISAHNLFQFTEVNRMLNTIVEDEYVLGSFAQTMGEQDVVSNLNEMFKDYDLKGYKYVAQKYHDLIKNDKLEVAESTSTECDLFGF